MREENRLPLATNFKNGPGRVLFVSRVFSGTNGFDCLMNLSLVIHWIGHGSI